MESFLTSSLFDAIYFGNTLRAYVFALGVFVAGLVVFHIVQRIVLGRLKKLAEKTETDIDDTLIQIVRSLKPPFYSFLAFYIAVQTLALVSFIEQAVDAVLIVWLTYQVIYAVQILIDYVIQKRFTDEENKSTQSALRLLGNIIKGVIWAVGILMILSNMGVNVTSLIAGLGIGGVAIAFALQSILGDLFGSFVIYFDKPFEVGDFVVVGEHSGTVEHVGIKSTRLRALQGEEIIIANQELTSARVQNFKKMKERRIVMSLGVTYETPTEKMRKVPDMIQNIFTTVQQVDLDRVHFKSFDDSALTFEIVYHVQTSDYSLYMDTQQDLNFKIKEAFEREGIDMAYPTQTIYMQQVASSK